MIDGPFSAPSSPPDTPVPTKCSPWTFSSPSRRIESGKWALPASMTMSPSSSSGTSSEITASVGPPALTMMTTLRGRSSDATNCSIVSDGTNVPSCPWSATSDSVLANDRLCTATVYPCRAKLRARLRPITAKPVTPICAPADMGGRSLRSGEVVRARVVACRPAGSACQTSGRQARARTLDDVMTNGQGAVPAEFLRALHSLRAARLRPEVHLEEVPGPGRIAPYSVALTGEVRLPRDEEGLAAGRFVVLHDPAGQEAWDRTFRVVTLGRGAPEPEVAADSLLAEVAWTWFEDAVAGAGVTAHAAGGTVTRVLSQSFGALADRPEEVEVELRASWTPLDAELGPHLT